MRFYAILLFLVVHRTTARVEPRNNVDIHRTYAEDLELDITLESSYKTQDFDTGTRKAKACPPCVHGVCNGDKCDCKPDNFGQTWAGRLCDSPLCDPPCNSARGACKNVNNKNVCVCNNAYWFGPTCNSFKCDPKCGVHGKCNGEYLIPTCDCTGKWTGGTCETRKCPEERFTSKHVYVCDDSEGSTDCTDASKALKFTQDNRENDGVTENTVFFSPKSTPLKYVPSTLPTGTDTGKETCYISSAATTFYCKRTAASWKDKNSYCVQLSGGCQAHHRWKETPDVENDVAGHLYVSSLTPKATCQAKPPKPPTFPAEF